jgi:hypothetical protein
MRGIRVYLGAAALLMAALMLVACPPANDRDPDKQVDRFDHLDWFVYSVIGEPGDSVHSLIGKPGDCPCCPIAYGCAEGRIWDECGQTESKIECCVCKVLLVSGDGRGWRIYEEGLRSPRYERTDFLFYTAARPDTCPCCPIGHSMVMKPDTCCPCDFYAAGGVQDVREFTSITMPEDIHTLISTDLDLPTRGRIFVTVTCDIERDPGDTDPLTVEMEIMAGERPTRMESAGERGGTWTIPPGSEETGYTTTVTLRDEFEVAAGEMPLSLVGKVATKGARAKAATRNLNVVFVPASDAGPIKSL